jgi:glycerate dehydrogenase
MHIVVLDGHALNPGDLSWQPLESLGTCTVHERTPSGEVVARVCDADIVLTNKASVTRDDMAQLPRLKYIGVLATGYNIVDVAAAAERGILVTNVPAYATPSVVQMVFAHLLHLTLHVGEHAQGVSAGRWSRSEDFCYWDFPLVELSGLTLGIVGFGRIGRATAAAARAFGMDVLAYDAIPPQDLPDGVQLAALDDLFRRSDAVTLHCPLTAETRHLVSAARLALMKPTAYLINTSRGPLVDEEALAAALEAGRIAGAGLDVLDCEPPAADNCLLSARNCYLTPHIAWATKAARGRLLAAATGNVAAFLAGRPQNVVNLV